MAQNTDTIEALFLEYKRDGSEDALTRLIQACQGLVFHYAKLYGGGYCYEDLCQTGFEGLLKAATNYDPDKGVKFTTYASHAIIGEIRHYTRRESRYYYPGYLERYKEKADIFIQERVNKEEMPVSLDELADALNLKEGAVLPVMGAGLVHLGHLELANIKVKEMESFTLPVEDKLLLSQLKYRLSDIQRDVIEMLYNQNMTQEEVANELGLTQKQVSRIKLRSLSKMKEKVDRD